MHPIYIWNLWFLQHREPLFSVAKATMDAPSSNCIVQSTHKSRSQWGVDMWFITESIGLNFFFSWSRQNLIIRFSTQMGDSRCVFNFNRLDQLVNNKEIYIGIFFMSTASARDSLTIQVSPPGLTHPWTVTSVAKKFMRYIIISAMSLERYNYKLCRCDMIERITHCL